MENINQSRTATDCTALRPLRLESLRADDAAEFTSITKSLSDLQQNNAENEEFRFLETDKFEEVLADFRFRGGSEVKSLL